MEIRCSFPSPLLNNLYSRPPNPLFPWATLLTSSTVLILSCMTCFWQQMGLSLAGSLKEMITCACFFGQLIYGIHRHFF